MAKEDGKGQFEPTGRMVPSDGSLPPFVEVASPDGKRILLRVNPGGQYASQFTPEEAQAHFEKRWAGSLMQERTVQTEGGATRTLAAYEVVFDSSWDNRRDLLTRFGMDAAEAGYRQVIGPVVVPDIAISTNGEPVAAAHFIFEKPTEVRGPTAEEQLLATKRELAQANKALEGYRRTNRQKVQKYRERKRRHVG